MEYPDRKKYIYDNISVESNKDSIVREILVEMDLTSAERKKEEKRQFYKQPIIPCPACKKDISSEAEICVHCGFPLKKELIRKGYHKEEQRSAAPKPVPKPDPNIVRCPKCGSTSISTQERGYSLMWGFWGASSKKNLCQKCGYTWWPSGKK